MTISESMREILDAESRAISQIPYTPDYDRAISLIIEHVHRRHGKLVTAGMGKAGQIALNIATTFSSTGTPAVNLHPSEAQHGDLGVLQPDDILLLVSNSGRTCEIIDLIALSKNLYPTIPIIVITGNPDSQLAELADATLLTASTTMMTVIGDILVVNVMRLTGFTREQYALRHHGGYLGSKSRT